MKFAPTTRIAVTMLALLLLFACSRGKPEPTRLFGEVYSYQSQQRVQKALGVTAGSWDVISRSELLKTDTRPAFNIAEVQVRDLYHHGVRGDLWMRFFNDRVMETRFYPSDIEIYRSTLTADGIAFGKDLETRLEPRTRVWIGKDRNARWYVGWSDTLLVNEHDAWIRKYSKAESL